jgi:hypothetical protein
VQFSYKRDSQKNALPSEAPPRRPSDPIRGGNIINKFLVTYFIHMKQRRTKKKFSPKHKNRIRVFFVPALNPVCSNMPW